MAGRRCPPHPTTTILSFHMQHHNTCCFPNARLNLLLDSAEKHDVITIFSYGALCYCNMLSLTMHIAFCSLRRIDEVGRTLQLDTVLLNLAASLEFSFGKLIRN